MISNGTSLAYQELQPQDFLDALEHLGFRCNGRLLALNSYENRVYQVGIDDRDAIVAKFYRPNRWSDAAILEEHAFACELDAREIPVVAPLEVSGSTLQKVSGFRVAGAAHRTSTISNYSSSWAASSPAFTWSANREPSDTVRASISTATHWRRVNTWSNTISFQQNYVRRTTA
jgi:hypothetical protein